MDNNRDNIVSRRDFLKLVGVGATVLAVGGFGGISNLFNTRSYKPARAQESSGGSWTRGPDTTTVAIHAALLPNGKIFYLAGSGFDFNDFINGNFEGRVLDPNTGSEKVLHQSEDLFCIGLASLASGNVLLAGGTKMFNDDPNNCNGKWHGLKSAYEFDINSEDLVPVSSMAHGRWYPTLVELPDGKIFTVGGLDEYGNTNRLTEVYDSGSKSWSIVRDPNSTGTYTLGGTASDASCPGAGSPSYSGGITPALSFYPRCHLMPGGLIVMAGWRKEIHSWNPANGDFVLLGNNGTDRHYGTSFLLPLQNEASEKGKILLVCGSPTGPDFAITTAEIVDFNASSSSIPVIRQTSPISYRRKYQCPVILPDGKLVIFGGSEQAQAFPVKVPEMFDPVTETWLSLSPTTISRMYHSVALLLPDGRIWISGGTPSGSKSGWNLATEFYSPDYLFRGARPTISGTATVGDYGGTITIPTSDGATITSVSLLRLMNTTHHYDANQRLVWLQISNAQSDSITVSAPINANIAPPGYYMIFILNALGVPSVAQIVKIPGNAGGGSDTTPPTQLTGLSVTGVTNNTVNLSWTANPPEDGVANYNIYRDTTAGFTPVLNTPLGTSTTNSYSDASGLAESTTYYYKVAAVDAAGNIGQVSDEASATTTNRRYYCSLTSYSISCYPSE